MASVSSSQGEHMTRTTIEGRKLEYQLRVLQQPERARACGCGVKSSADRRPVDPPPVCELKIFELGPNNEKSDITFSYNANFFLYASLELARPIAHGRVAPSAANQIPVLTGMPVSGMAYLDRPTEAGYFIFPDLSVRHEGKYKLQFNLYEETKDPKDYDPEEPKREGLSSQPGQNASFIWRLEVKSLPFTVYSAKKFPGLAESTVLSRTVAEQGCRVRIRRDVRMRRRDGKNSGEFDDYDEEYSRQRTRTRTPDPAFHRVRSMSNASIDRSEPYSADQSRRPSIVDYSSQSYQSNYSPANAGQQNGPPTSYLSFGAGSNAPQYQTPTPYAQPPTPAQPVQTNQQYQPQTYDQSPASYRQNSVSTNTSHTTYNERPYQPYQPSTPVAPRESHEQERRPSVGLPATRYQAAPQYNAPEANYRNQSLPYQQPYTAQKASGPSLTPLVNLAPIKMPPLEPRYEALTSPAGPLSANRMAPPLPSPFEAPHAVSRPSSTYSSYATASSTPTAVEAPRSSKRPFEAVFSTASYNQPLHNGMRPSSSHHNGPSPGFDDDDDGNMEDMKMQYKRADGSSHARALPNLQ